MPANNYDQELIGYSAGTLNKRERQGVRRVLKSEELRHEITRLVKIWAGYAAIVVPATYGIVKWVAPHLKF